MAAWAGFVAAFLWPLYGFFCQMVLHLPERMPARFALGAVYFVLAILARVRKFRWDAHALWILGAGMGMIWLPWMLYLDSQRAAYWVASISFFGTILGFAVRPLDLIPAFLLAIGLGVVTDGAPTSLLDVGIVAVFLISTWIGSRMSQMLWEARRRIGFQNRRILHQNNRLKELHRAKNIFTASVAHDLRTPLAVATSLAGELAKEQLDQASRNRLESLSMALEQLRRQSENLFDLERFQLGVSRLDPCDLDVVAWMRHFEEGFASIARTRRISFQVVLHVGELYAHFDPVRMETVIHNLVSNALKFTPSGGHVEVHLAIEEGRTLVLSVIDDGEGIPPNSLPHIFDRFQQVDRGPGTYTVGAGIGLALVREIVEAHGGTIRVQSTPGLGSLFEIRLPDTLIRAESLPMQPDPLPDTAATRESAHILVKALVVEDDPLLRQVLTDILEGTAQVATAGNGHEGLRVARETLPDIIVSDVAMPRMNGLEFFDELRADPQLCHIPVVLLSGDAPGVSNRVAGFDRVSVQPKPFDRDILIQTIHDLIEISRKA